MSLNPGPLILGVLNARSARNKGPLRADIVASNDLHFLCLTETHVHPSDSDCFYSLLLLMIAYFLIGLVPHVLVVVLVFY